MSVNYRLVNCGAREGRGGAVPAPGAVLAAGAIRGAGGGHGNKGRRGREGERVGWRLSAGGSPARPALLLSRSPGGEERSVAAPGPGRAGGTANEVRELHQKGECGGDGASGGGARCLTTPSRFAAAGSKVSGLPGGRSRQDSLMPGRPRQRPGQPYRRDGVAMEPPARDSIVPVAT